MTSKRESPLSGGADDLALSRRRALAAARIQRLRERQRAERDARPRPTPAQLQQDEQILSLEMTNEEQAAMTLTQFSLRASILKLAQDAEDAQLQQGATEVDEHCTLYEPHTPPATSHDYLPLSQPSTPTSTSRSSPTLAQHQPSQSQLLDFVSRRPAGNPFTTSTRHILPRPPLPPRPPRPPRPGHPARPSRPSPVRPSFSLLSSMRPSTPRPFFSPLSSSVTENILAQHRGSEDFVFADNDLTADDDNDDGDFREDESIHQPDHTAGKRDGSSSDGTSDPGIAGRAHLQTNNFADQHADSGEEDSAYDFASERSALPSDEENDEQPPSRLGTTL